MLPDQVGDAWGLRAVTKQGGRPEGPAAAASAEGWPGRLADPRPDPDERFSLSLLDVGLGRLLDPDPEDPPGEDEDDT
jgi:hypothetical protein